MLSQNFLIDFNAQVEQLKERTCLRYKKTGTWRDLSWTETKARIVQISDGLLALALKPGDKACILSNTRYEWTLADAAIMSCAAVTVPIYQSSNAEECAYIINHSEAKLIFVEDKKQLKKILEIRPKLKTLKHIVLITNKSAEKDILTLKELAKLGVEKPSHSFEQRIEKIKSEDLATLVYTSGTTGVPKGVMLTHQNIVYKIDEVRTLIEISPDLVGLIWLPLAHILGRKVTLMQLSTGYIHAYAESIDKLVENIKEVQPQFMVNVPRIFEKIYTKVMGDVENSSSIKKSIFNWAVCTGKKVGQYLINNQSVPFFLNLRYKLAHQLVFSKLHEKMGGRLEFFISGGAPLSHEINEFFLAAGLPIMEGYGLTETVAAAFCNSFERRRLETVGPVFKHTQVKIAEDGEILLKGKATFPGYYKEEKATQECFSGDWFHTGDIGEIDADGFLKITDRKKDIIVTAGGKNIAPQPIENSLKDETIISQAMVHGDRRKYMSALVTLDPVQVQNLAKSLGIETAVHEEIVLDERVKAKVKAVIDKINKNLPSYESLKKFAIVAEDFTVENGLLTPSLKVKRKLVTQKYEDLLNSFYSE